MDARDDRAAEIARGLEALFECGKPVQRAQFVDQEPQPEYRVRDMDMRVFMPVSIQSVRSREATLMSIYRADRNRMEPFRRSSSTHLRIEKRGPASRHQLQCLGVGIEHRADGSAACAPLRAR